MSVIKRSNLDICYQIFDKFLMKLTTEQPNTDITILVK